MDKEQGEELARLEIVMQEEARRDGLNSIKEDDYRLIEHRDWDELYTWGQEGTDTNYLHY